MDPTTENDAAELRAEIERLLADAIRVAGETAAETARVQGAHDGEVAGLRHEIEGLVADAMRLASETAAETDRVQAEHARLVASLESALASRDLFGKAKGIIMASMHCTADEAWQLIAKQSQVENRKALDVAREIAERVASRALRSRHRAS